MTLLRSETLAWHRFKQIVKTEDVSICYDMSMREFKRSKSHDLFKVHKYTFLFLLNMYMSIQALNVMFQVMSKLMIASMQAKDLDKEKKRLDVRVRELEGALRRNSKENMKLEHTSKKLSTKVKELKELVEELKIDIVKKETRLDHLQRTNDDFSKTKEEIIAEI